MVWDPDCVFYCMSLQYYCAGYCIHLLTGSCINKIKNKIDFELIEPQKRKIVKKSYADNSTK